MLYIQSSAIDAIKKYQCSLTVVKTKMCEKTNTFLGKQYG